MKKLLIILFLLPLASLAQFMQPTGTIIGNQTVISIPVAPAGYPTAQALIYYPDDYSLPKNAGKKYPLFVFLHGSGEGRLNDIAEVTNTSLPQLIKQGLKPYTVDASTGDTVKYIVVSPHAASTGSSYYYPQLQYTIPYLLNTYRVDTTCVWVGGLSAGARGTWSVVMGMLVGDTALGKKITGIMPIANGGYDNMLATLAPNLDTLAKRGLACLYTLGSQDPGYNQIGFFAYQALMKKYCIPGRYYDTVITGGIHDDKVWNPPFYMTSRLWFKTMNAWDQMWALRKNGVSVKPPFPVSAPHAVVAIDSTVINYPNSVVHLTAGSSYITNGTIKVVDFYLDSGDARVILSQSDSSGICASGLRPGNYRFKLVVTDSLGNKDSAYAGVKVNGPVIPVCPVCPPPVVCPPQRKVTAIQLSINGIMFNIPLAGTKISYDNGTSQP